MIGERVADLARDVAGRALEDRPVVGVREGGKEREGGGGATRGE